MVRTLLIVWLALVCVCASDWNRIASSDDELRQRDVTQLVDEYVSSDTVEERRSAIVEKLRSADPLLVVRPLKRAIRKDEWRPRALRLAVELKVSGLFRLVKPYVDSEDEDVIIDLFLVTEDKKGIELLAKRYRELAVESVSFQLLQKALTSVWIGSEYLVSWRDCMEDEDRGESAVEVLRWQFDKPELTPSELEQEWDKLIDERDTHFKKWDTTGIDIFEFEGWESENITRYGGNRLVADDGWMMLKEVPDDLKADTLKLKVRTCILSGEGGSFFIGFESLERGYLCRLEESRWVTHDVDGAVATHVPFKAGEWQEHIWQITPRRGGLLKVVVTVDGKELVENGIASEQVGGILIKGEGSEFLVGGFEILDD